MTNNVNSNIISDIKTKLTILMYLFKVFKYLYDLYFKIILYI